jgi:hypothetical protein
VCLLQIFHLNLKLQIKNVTRLIIWHYKYFRTIESCHQEYICTYVHKSPSEENQIICAIVYLCTHWQITTFSKASFRWENIPFLWELLSLFSFLCFIGLFSRVALSENKVLQVHWLHYCQPRRENYVFGRKNRPSQFLGRELVLIIENWL